MSNTRKYGDPVVAERLRHARLAAGYATAREAAAAFGWSESTYRSHEGGARAIPAAALVAYAETLRVNVAWLRGSDEVAGPSPSAVVSRAGSRPPSTPNTNLIEARRRVGFPTAAAAAMRFGWKRSTYFAHENGQNNLTDEVAELYAYAFGVEPSWILGIVGSRLPAVTRIRDPLAVRAFEKELRDRPAVGAKLGLDAGFFLVPELTNGAIAHLGTMGSLPEGQTFLGRRWGFPVDYLEEVVDVEPSQVRVGVLHVTDPKLGLRAGDRLLIDVGDREWGASGEFAMVDRLGLLRIVRPGVDEDPKAGGNLLGRVVAFMGRPSLSGEHGSAAMDGVR